MLNACSTQRPLANEAKSTTKPSLATIKFQEKKVIHFQNGNLHFSNNFLSARLNSVTALNDSTFEIYIEPENTPVNPSPWYAFKVWSTTDQNAHIILSYSGSRHRYNPKFSYGGNAWKDVSDVALSRDSSKAYFVLPVKKDTLTIAAQEIISSVSCYGWIDSLSALPFINKQIIGHSILGKPVIALNTRGSSGKKIIVVLSRQHPPEVTGYMAMREFVHTITGSADLAADFRKEYELIVIPLINPDGVDEGTWRHNAAGIDLNRDWISFQQPETRAVKDFLFKAIKKQKAKVYFGIDFHSTWYDVFYTNTDTATNSPGLTRKWLAAFQQAIPGFKATIRPSGNEGNVSKSWMMRALGADALTYEVGDNTSRDMIKKKGRIAAEKLMECLLEGR